MRKIHISPTTLINLIKRNKAIGPNIIPTKITDLPESLSDEINVSFSKRIFDHFYEEVC